MQEELSTLRPGVDVGTGEMRKRLAILSCQLKKEQAMSRRFQVATERLLQFVEVKEYSWLGLSDTLTFKQSVELCTEPEITQLGMLTESLVVISAKLQAN